MNEAALRFFDSQPNALPLYEMLEARILNEIPGYHLDKDTTSIPRWLLLNRYSRRAG